MCVRHQKKVLQLFLWRHVPRFHSIQQCQDPYFGFHWSKWVGKKILRKNLYCWSTFVFWSIFISQIQEYFHFLLEVRSWTPRCHCVTPIYPNWPQFTPFDPNWPKLPPIDHVWPLWTSLTKIDLNLPQLTSIDRNWLQLTPNCSQLTQLTLTW